MTNTDNRYTLWTKEIGFCPKCMMAKQVLEANGVEFVERAIDSEENLAHLETFKSIGISSAPIITKGVTTNRLEVVSTGFEPDILAKL